MSALHTNRAPEAPRRPASLVGEEAHDAPSAAGPDRSAGEPADPIPAEPIPVEPIPVEPIPVEEEQASRSKEPGLRLDLGDRPAVWQMPPVIAALVEVLRPLARYHRHEVHGLKHLPKEGGVLVVTSHSLATYDGLLLGLAAFEATGRVPTGLADDTIFRIPLVGDLVRQAGLEPASPGNGERLLRAGRMLCVAPGGMREALRPSEQRYEFSWARRRGFVRLALRAQVPIVLAACPAADDIFTVVDNPVTPVIYELFKLPLPLFFGRRKLPVPRQVKLVHHLAEPIVPPPHEPEHEDRQVEALHARALERMERLMERARDEQARETAEPGESTP